ncbi:MAG: hypothetical protein HC857_04630 [Synechococcales cyanobacterium RU_4_20]|nr:hypothetical protein [Synechococcales cyanobacterium RU_4_20]
MNLKFGFVALPTVAMLGLTAVFSNPAQAASTTLSNSSQSLAVQTRSFQTRPTLSSPSVQPGRQLTMEGYYNRGFSRANSGDYAGRSPTFPRLWPLCLASMKPISIGLWPRISVETRRGAIADSFPNPSPRSTPNTLGPTSIEARCTWTAANCGKP